MGRTVEDTLDGEPLVDPMLQGKICFHEVQAGCWLGWAGQEIVRNKAFLCLLQFWVK